MSKLIVFATSVAPVSPETKMACRHGTNKIIDRRAECAFPACASCGTQRDVKEGMVGKKDKNAIVRDGETTRAWYCGILMNTK